MRKFVNIEPSIFFDRPGIIDRMDAKKRKVLGGTGAASRVYMKRGMRRTKSPSNPGEFPRARSGELRDLIYFGFDVPSESLVVGPTLFKSSSLDTVRVSGGAQTIPELVNYGGTVYRQTYSRKTKSYSRPKRQIYKPRPFVELTLPYATKVMAEKMASIPF